MIVKQRASPRSSPLVPRAPCNLSAIENKQQRWTNSGVYRNPPLASLRTHRFWHQPRRATLNRVECGLISNHFRVFHLPEMYFEGSHGAETFLQMQKRPMNYNAVIRVEGSDNNLLIVTVAARSIGYEHDLLGRVSFFFSCCNATVCYQALFPCAATGFLNCCDWW